MNFKDFIKKRFAGEAEAMAKAAPESKEDNSSAEDINGSAAKIYPKITENSENNLKK